MAAETYPVTDWEGRLLRWANLGLEAAVFYLLLAAWVRPRDGTAALLPLLACLALPAGLAIRNLLDSTTVADLTRHLAAALAALAWAATAARVCAPPGYWEADAPRALLVVGAMVGGRDNPGLQPLAFWAALLLWWRGHALAAWEPGFDDALTRLRLGLVAVGAAVGLPAVADESAAGLSAQFEQLVGVGVFLVIALATTGLARRREMAGAGPAATGPPASPPAPAARPTPAGLALAPVLVIVAALTVLAVAALGADALSPDALGPAVALGARALEAFGTAFAWLLAQLGAAWSGLAPPLPAEPPARPITPSGDRTPGLPISAPDWLGPLVLILLSAVAAAGAMLLLVGLRRMLHWRADDTSNAVEGDDGPPTPVVPRHPATILALLVRLFRSLAERRESKLRNLAPVATLATPRQPTVESIRAAYRAYLRWSARRGLPRRPDETPDEFRRRLVAACPSVELEAELLTSLYVAARYGHAACSPNDLRRAQLALDRLESQLELQSPTTNPQIASRRDAR